MMLLLMVAVYLFVCTSIFGVWTLCGAWGRGFAVDGYVYMDGIEEQPTEKITYLFIRFTKSVCCIAVGG